MTDVSALDNKILALIRANVDELIAEAARRHDRPGTLVLDVAPQVHAGVNAHFHHSIVETLDVDPTAAVTYTADLCDSNHSLIPSNRFDVVVCTEVLEHVLFPFAAVEELARLLRPGGTVFVSTPFNFRIHGPLPDCWRFTEHGLRSLFRHFEIVELGALESDDRPLMPIHYTMVARKPLDAGG